MNLLTKTKFKNVFIILLSIVMAFSVIFATACSKDDGDTGNSNNNTETTDTSPTDYQIVKNGDFEFSTDGENKVFPVSSSINWANSYDSGAQGNTAHTTTNYAKSGIIDTEETAYNKVDNKYKPVVTPESNGVSAVYYNPNTPYYYGLVENAFADNETDNVNPQADGTKILQIQNKSSSIGTAQKFKNTSSISLNADSYAIFSVWVKTKDLKAYSSNKTPGAYIALDFKVGTVDYKTVYFNNINTNGEWTLFEAEIQTYEYANTTLNITFGLGKGNSFATVGYVEGFAYFDNAQIKTYNKQEYDAKKTAPSANVITVSKTDVENNAINASALVPTFTGTNPTEKTTYSNTAKNYSLFESTLNFRKTDVVGTAISGTTVKNVSDEYFNANCQNVKLGFASDITTDFDGKADLTEALSDINKIGTANPSLAYMNFKDSHCSATFTSEEITLNAESYKLVTFFVKSNADRPNADKVVIDVIDVNASNKEISAFSSFTTQKVEEGNYGTWVKYSIILENKTDVATPFKLQIKFGPSIENEFIQDALFLQSGYALIADIKHIDVDKDFYTYSTSVNNCTKTSLQGVYGAYGEGVETVVKDLYSTSVDKLGEFEIKTKPTSNTNTYSLRKENDNDNVVSGIINSKYNANYTGINGLDTFAKLTSNNNKYAQAVVLQNNAELNSAMITNVSTITANTFMKIKVKIRVIGDAKATVYLVTNTITDGEYDVMSISANDWSETLKATVDKNSKTINEWTEVCFYIASGNKNVDYRIEVWNGDRPANNNKSQGTIFFESVVSSAYEEASFAYDKDLYVDEYKNSDDPFSTTHSHTRAPSTVKETVDGETVTSTQYYQEKVIFIGNSLVKFADYTTLFADTEIDNTLAEEETPETEEEEDTGYKVEKDVALQISSIIIAVVLMAVMVIVFIRTVTKNKKKKKEKVASFYDRTSREKTLNKISKKKSEIVLDENTSEDYDYEKAQKVDETENDEVENESSDATVIDVEQLKENPENLDTEGGSEETSEEASETNETASEDENN